MTTDLARPALEGTIVQPKALRIFGREPAALLGVIEAVLAALVAFGLGVTNESAGLIAAVISLAIGAYTAWATRDTMLGVATGLAKAIIALVVYYGVTLTPEQVAAVVTLVPLVVGFWQRTQTTPVAAPVDPSPTQVTPSPVDVATGDGLEAAGSVQAGITQLTQDALSQPYSGDGKAAAAYHPGGYVGRQEDPVAAPDDTRGE